MMYIKRSLFFLLVLIFALLIAVLFYSCGVKREPLKINLPEGKTGRIIYLVGDVFISQDGKQWEKANIGSRIMEDMLLKTGPNSYCEIILNNGTLFRMKDRSQIHFVLLPSGEKYNRSMIEVIRGEILGKALRVGYKSIDTFITGTLNVEVKGTEFIIKATEGEKGGFTEVMVGTGKVIVRINATIPSSSERTKALSRIERKIKRGFVLRENSSLVFEGARLQRINNLLQKLVSSKDPSIEDELEKEIILTPLPIDEKEALKFEELKNIQPEFVIGDDFYLSPNFDGIKDIMIFRPGRAVKSKVMGWRFCIVDGRGRIRKIILNRPPEIEEFVEIPEEIQWNCIADNGQVLEDGVYSYEFYVNEKNGLEKLLIKGRVFIDKTPPKLSFTVNDISFSPNGDDIKDTIKFNVSTEEAVKWTFTVSTPEGIIVKTDEWEGKPPEEIIWDGTGDNEAILPDGVYNITLSGEDVAGNVASKTIEGITIDVRERQASIWVDNPIFSPNGDGKLDRVTFYPVLSDRSRIDTWDLVVQTEKGDTARRFRGRRYVPRRIVWDGKPKTTYDFEVKELPSGKYYYFMKIIYRSGVNTYAFKKELILDNDPPKISLEIEPKLFSPDGDGVDDFLYIRPTIQDISTIKSWKAVIYTSDGRVFKTFEGKGEPAKELVWDGLSDRGYLVDSGEDYYCIFEATDAGYNTGVSERVDFSIDILVIPTERGLKIRISNIEFGFDNDTLEGEKTFEILDKIVEVLKKYSDYSVIIEGHTDNVGDERYNLILSKRRARAVGMYLIRHGIAEERLSYVGHGPRYPIDTNDTPEGRARNRRVEFILVKEKR